MPSERTSAPASRSAGTKAPSRDSDTTTWRYRVDAETSRNSMRSAPPAPNSVMTWTIAGFIAARRDRRFRGTRLCACAPMSRQAAGTSPLAATISLKIRGFDAWSRLRDRRWRDTRTKGNYQRSVPPPEHYECGVSAGRMTKRWQELPRICANRVRRSNDIRDPNTIEPV